MNSKKSREDYLERILMLQEEHGSVRSVDIANAMSFSKASVSIALKKLREEKLVNFADDGTVHLTTTGYLTATTIYERHKVISASLMALGVDEKTALEDACLIEHDISPKTFEVLKEHYLKYRDKINK